MKWWRDKVVVVTGASSGLGRAVVRLLGARRAKVALIARGLDGLQAAAAEVEAAGGEALVLPLDLADSPAVMAAARTVVARWGAIDVWVNNAMVSVFAPISAMKPDEYRRVTEVNYLGTVYGTMAALEQMRPADHGSIVQVGSALAYRSIPLQSAYCASKSAIRGFTDSLRCELERYRSRIKLTMVHLPAMNTPQFVVVRNRLGKHARPVGPIYEPEAVAKSILYSAQHGPRELWVGGRTMEAIVGQRVFPGRLDRALGRHAWEAQTTDDLPMPPTDNLDAPLPGDRGAHGPFAAEAKRWCLPLWARMNARVLLAGSLLVSLAAVIAGRRLARG